LKFLIKHILIFILFIFSCPVIGQEIFIDEIQSENYPILSAEFILFDSDGEAVIPEKDSILIFEYIVVQKVESVECDEQNLRKTKAIIVIDISSSMLGQGEEFAKIIAQNLLKNKEKYFSEIAIIAFNQYSYLLNNFSSDENIIQNSLNKLDPRGGTDFDTLFFDNQNGIFSLIDNNDNEEYSVFMITDGNAAGDFEKIGDSLSTLGVQLYSFGLFRNLPKKISDVSKNTGGKYRGNISNEKDAEFSASVFSLISSNYKPCKIEWKSYYCGLYRNSNFVWSGKKIKDFEYYLTEDQIPTITFSPSDVIVFENTEQDKKYQKTINLKIIGGDIVYDEIIFECDEFGIDDSDLPDTLLEDQTYSLRVEYSPTDAIADICQFSINPSKCQNLNFYATTSDDLIISNSLRINSPKSKEILIAGDKHRISWSGSLPSDSVQIEWTSDGGIVWNLEDEKTVGNNYFWDVPDINSQNCKIKLSKLNDDDKLSNVNYLKFSNKDILGLEWSRSDNLFAGISFVSDEYDLRLFDYDKSEFKDEGWGNLQDLRTLKWANKLPKLAVHKDFGDKNGPIVFEIGGASPIELEGVLGENREVNALAFSPDDESIVGGLINGDILIWENFSQNESIDFFYDKLFESQITSIDWNINNFIASGNILGEISIISILADTVAKYYFSDTEIKYLKWSKSGDSLFVATENDGVFFLKYIEFDGGFSFSQGKIYEKNKNISDAFWDEVNENIFIATSNIVKIIDYDGNVVYEFKGHTEDVKFIDYNGEKIISSDGGKDVLIWDPYEYPHEKGILQSVESDVFEIRPPDIRLNEINLGTFCKGFQVDTTETFALVNRTGVDIIIDSIQIKNNLLSEIVVRVEFPKLIEKDASSNLVFNVNPQSKGDKSFKMDVYSYSKTFSTQIITQFISPEISLSTSQINFENVNISDTFSETFEIENNGDLDVNVSKIEFLFGEEFFDLEENMDSFVLKSKFSRTFTTLFSPNDRNIYSGLLKVHTGENCTPLEIRLGGRGVSPEFSSLDLIDFGDIYCDSQIDTIIQIHNTGDGNLVINKIDFNENKFQIDSEIFPIKIMPDSIYNLLITFKSVDYDKFSEEIIVEHNKLFSKNISSTINIIGENVYSDFSTSTGELIFSDIVAGESKTLSFEIINNGTQEFSPNKQIFDDFEIVSIIPESIPAKSLGVITVKFLGGQDGISYEEIYEIKDTCGNISEINLIANPGVNRPYLSAISEIKMKNDFCNPQFDSLIIIKNSGSKDLIIDSIILKNNLSDVFNLNNINQLDKIEPKKQGEFKLGFLPDEPGEYKSEIIVYSNDERNSGKYIISLNAVYFKQEIVFSTDTINFTNLIENQSYSKNITIYNKGFPDYELENQYAEGDFIIDNFSDNIVPARDSISARLTFLGANAGEEKSVTFLLVDTCEIETIFIANAIVRGADFAEISGEEFSSRPGENESFAIYFNNSTSFNYQGDINISTTISFNASLLYPASVEKGIVVDGRRYLPINASFDPKDKFIIAPEFTTTLGDSPETEIRFERTIIEDYPKIWFESTASTFTVLGAEDGGGRRLITSGDDYGISNIRPNPADQIINFEVYMPGEDFVVQIADSEGRTLRKYKKQASPNPVPFELDVSKYAASNYFIIVDGKNSSFSKIFVIRR
jgi:von Willebrand factor type A domain